MYMNSSASRAGVVANAQDFEVGYGMLPYYDDVDGAPQNSIIGGATLWVLQGHPEEEYKGGGRLLHLPLLAEVQADWHQFSGYLPITPGPPMTWAASRVITKPTPAPTSASSRSR
jgi:sn-glycerol 3-phosphate transport system substrate-binding protein